MSGPLPFRVLRPGHLDIPTLAPFFLNLYCRFSVTYCEIMVPIQNLRAKYGKLWHRLNGRYEHAVDDTPHSPLAIIPIQFLPDLEKLRIEALPKEHRRGASDCRLSNPGLPATPAIDTCSTENFQGAPATLPYSVTNSFYSIPSNPREAGQPIVSPSFEPIHFKGAVIAADNSFRRGFGRQSNKAPSQQQSPQQQQQQQQPQQNRGMASPIYQNPPPLQPSSSQNLPQSPAMSSTVSFESQQGSDNSYQQHRNPPFFFREKYATLIVKGNFMTLAAKPVLIEEGEWLAHQGTLIRTRLLTHMPSQLL